MDKTGGWGSKEDGGNKRKRKKEWSNSIQTTKADPNRTCSVARQIETRKRTIFKIFGFL